jgi:hypothetical protein
LLCLQRGPALELLVQERFDFGGALTGPALEPGAQTNPVSFRFQFVDPAKAPTLRLKAVGMVSASPAS